MLLNRELNVIPNNCVTWSAEQFAAGFVEVLPNSLTGNAADLLPCLSDGFGFLLLDAETTGPGAGLSRNRYITNDNLISK